MTPQQALDKNQEQIVIDTSEDIKTFILQNNEIYSIYMHKSGAGKSMHCSYATSSKLFKTILYFDIFLLSRRFTFTCINHICLKQLIYYICKFK